jgi:subtilisin family serine protease
MANKLFWFAFCASWFGLNPSVWSLSESFSENGINAYILQQPPYNLSGRKISIGQVEIGRPGKFGLDKAANKQKGLSLAGSFFRNQGAISNQNVDSHATMVASIMINQDKKLPGIAPQARLYSSAVGSFQKGGQPEECLASQHIALQNSDDLRVINFSFGESLEQDSRKEPKLDGNALLTQCIDWSARVHDVLYVVAGNQGSGGIPIPTDNYNSITTAYTDKRQGVFKKVDFANLSALPLGIGRSLIKREINFGTRRAISLLAPGNNIPVYDLDGKIQKVSGTSFAAPHITASVALLQEAGDRFLYQRRPLWSKDYRRHQVMKAILLNSADKIKDQGDGNLLGMTRTVLSKKNQTWLESDAYFDPKIPVDMQMGVGHLNVYRAYQQMNAGQWSYQQTVPNKGWNYGQIKANSEQDYGLAKPLKEDSFVSITLVWDRLVELEDKNQNQLYDLGEKFTNQGLNNLDVYLVTQDNRQLNHKCYSVSEVDSIEHIFCKVPQPGKYKIKVKFTAQINQDRQPYALAWDTVSDPQF